MNSVKKSTAVEKEIKIMKTLDNILTTHLYRLDDQHVLQPIEEQFEKSRQAMLYELKTTRDALEKQEIDLVEDYQISIALLEEASDEQFEFWKNQLKREGELL
ncbi:TPA: hypothetical protein U1C24_001771 [Streptococcus suis]|nr:hypothetical protein [Streptococcus suis]HEM3627330.1 hypothetical protein [Streptococcus suis]HEM3631980.1 hypothetical protein [Streptococcus suis]HEM3640736.1 hypothetical protein [Streptococcus suis]HEM3645250.1 hypothetical protein [Streptococcus suis]